MAKKIPEKGLICVSGELDSIPNCDTLIWGKSLTISVQSPNYLFIPSTDSYQLKTCLLK